MLYSIVDGCTWLGIKKEISASADGGPHTQALRTRDPPLGTPIDTSGTFPAHMSAESPSNISPNHSEVISEVSET